MCWGRDPWAGARDRARGPGAGAGDGTHLINRARRPLMDPIAPYMANNGPMVPNGNVWAYSIQSASLYRRSRLEKSFSIHVLHTERSS
jgi:hypothetical protein